jgi:hypothetical protein
MLTRALAAWRGPRWRWWALLAGLALTGACLLGGLLCAELFGMSASALMLLWVLLALLVTGAIGAGLFDRFSEAQPSSPPRRPTLAARMAPQTPEELVPHVKTADEERRDRTTIRAGIIALPLVIAFFVLLLG